MSLHVTTPIGRGAKVPADSPGVAAGRAALVAAAAGARVADLHGVASAMPEGVHELAGALGTNLDLPRDHVVARRDSLLHTLALARIHHRVAVHQSMDEALAAHRAAAGGGEPWR